LGIENSIGGSDRAAAAIVEDCPAASQDRGFVYIFAIALLTIKVVHVTL
jgi:hypothetical protein